MFKIPGAHVLWRRSSQNITPDKSRQKVYFVVKEPSEHTINHFVTSLGMALQKQGCVVVYGLERLWTDDVFDCDIVHFQWPEFIWGPPKIVFSDNDVVRISHRLAQLKECEALF